MLKVLPIQSKTDQELDCARCGITYRPDALAYRATVNDVFVGMCQFKLTEHGGEIYDIAKLPDVEDFEAMFVMGRAALNFIDLCGVHYARYLSENIDESLAREEKVYQIICAEYTGEKTIYTPTELIFGRQNIERRGEAFELYSQYVRSVFEVRLRGKQCAGADTAEEEKMLRAIDELLK